MERESIARVLEAYLLVISEMGGSVIYLLYITAAVIGSMATTLLYNILGEGTMTFAVSAISFIALFSVATYSSFIVSRLDRFFREAEGLRFTRAFGAVLVLCWIVPFAALSPLLLSSPWGPERTYCIWLSVSLAIGNLCLFLLEAKYGRRKDVKPLFVAAYLLITAPSYLLLTGELVYFLVTFNLAFSYFFVAVWYLISAWRGAEGILHAARGHREEGAGEGQDPWG